MSKPEKKPKNGAEPEALVEGLIPVKMTDEERRQAVAAGASFAKAVAGESPEPCLVIAGSFVPPGYPGPTADEQVKKCLVDAFGYQQSRESTRRMHVLLDSKGGSLDSAFKIVRYLTWYAKEIVVYVPREAKSASTLLALGARRIYLSPFGELGPLDAQIPDPRNPMTSASALDCYQSVDYVRKFGVDTMSQALSRLGDDARSQIAFVDLIGAASSFGTGAIKPMLQGIKALDFGAWGRSLQIGEKYARQILNRNREIFCDNGPPDADGEGAFTESTSSDRAAEIASVLVYGFLHHKYFMDYREVKSLGLETEIMSKDVYEAAMAVLQCCEGRSFIDFVSDAEKDRRAKARGESSAKDPGVVVQAADR